MGVAFWGKWEGLCSSGWGKGGWGSSTPSPIRAGQVWVGQTQGGFPTTPQGVALGVAHRGLHEVGLVHPGGAVDLRVAPGGSRLGLPRTPR